MFLPIHDIFWFFYFQQIIPFKIKKASYPIFWNLSIPANYQYFPYLEVESIASEWGNIKVLKTKFKKTIQKKDIALLIFFSLWYGVRKTHGNMNLYKLTYQNTAIEQWNSCLLTCRNHRGKNSYKCIETVRGVSICRPDWTSPKWPEYANLSGHLHLGFFKFNGHKKLISEQRRALNAKHYS